MKGVQYLILLVALTSASACKYFCRKPGTFEYECCDDGNPNITTVETPSVEEELLQTPVADVLVEDEVAVEETCIKYWCLVPNTTDEYVCCDYGNPFTGEAAPSDPRATQAPSDCYYFCAYDGEVYCCGDTSRPIPESHASHAGNCAAEEDQVCKSAGVYFNPASPNKKYRAKTAGAVLLAEGKAKEMPSCASDGYCKKDERCCPSKCAKRHICLKALHEDDQE